MTFGIRYYVDLKNQLLIIGNEKINSFQNNDRAVVDAIWFCAGL